MYTVSMHPFLRSIARTIRATLNKKGSGYEPLVTISIDRQAILNNLRDFERDLKLVKPDARIAPVLKSNAYGHGLYEVAHILESNSSTPFFIVDSYFEAHTLRNRGITTPLLIIGYTPSVTMVENTLTDIRFTITSLDELKTLKEIASKNNKSINIHLKIDTGMCRQGILVSELDQALNLFGESITLEGITAHLADADGDDPSFTMTQIHIWNDVVKKVRARFPTLTWWHTSATAGHRFTKDIDANLTRLGIGLYLGKDNRSPALEMTTIITSIKKITKVPASAIMAPSLRHTT